MNRSEHATTESALREHVLIKLVKRVSLSFFFAINRLLKLTNLAKRFRHAFCHKADFQSLCAQGPYSLLAKVLCILKSSIKKLI